MGQDQIQKKRQDVNGLGRMSHMSKSKRGLKWSGQEEILQQERNKTARIMMIEDDEGMRSLPAGFLAHLYRGQEIRHCRCPKLHHDPLRMVSIRNLIGSIKFDKK